MPMNCWALIDTTSSRGDLEVLKPCFTLAWRTWTSSTIARYRHGRFRTNILGFLEGCLIKVPELYRYAIPGPGSYALQIASAAVSHGSSTFLAARS